MSSSPSTWTTMRPDNDLKDNPFRFAITSAPAGGQQPPTGTCQSNPSAFRAAMIRITVPWVRIPPFGPEAGRVDGLCGHQVIGQEA